MVDVVIYQMSEHQEGRNPLENIPVPCEDPCREASSSSAGQSPGHEEGKSFSVGEQSWTGWGDPTAATAPSYTPAPRNHRKKKPPL